MLIVCRDQSEQVPLHTGMLCQIDVREYTGRNGMAAVKGCVCRTNYDRRLFLCRNFRAKEVLKMESKFTAFSELPVILSATDVASILGVSRAFAYNLFSCQ